MRIGIDARMYGPRQTGIGNYIKYLIKELELLDTRNEYYVFLGAEQFSDVTFFNPHFHKVLADIPWYSLGEQIFFLKQLYGYRLDIMHFTHFNVAMLYRRRFIVTIHDLTPRLFPGEKIGKSWIRRLGYTVAVKNAIRSSQAIISPSQFTKGEILNTFQVSQDKIKVIYEGIPFSGKDPGSPLLTDPYILYVGVWRSHKNLQGLLRAFALLKETGLPHRLVLVGDPDIYYQPLKDLWESLGLAGQVVSTGFQSDARLASWYTHAKLLVLPSFSEGFGLTPLVALTHGLPVAVSDIPVLREVLALAAHYFNPHDPLDIAKIIAHALKNNARHTIPREYSWKKMAQETRALYEAKLH